jgi:hypothetical protein
MGVWMDILSLQPLGGGSLIEPQLEGGQVSFPQVPDGRLLLRGRVNWLNDRDEKLKQDNLWVQVRVNGFQQLPARLKLPAGGQPAREFQAEVVLNREKDNRIELELLGLKQEADNAATIHVRHCQRPRKGMWLHLLIVAVGEKDERSLVNQLLQAVRLQSPGDAPGTAFERVQIYGPLTNEYATEDRVMTQLYAIKHQVEQRAREGWPNDVVMVYYSGRQEITSSGHFLQTHIRQAPIRCADLEQFFRFNLGAQMVMLDVRSTGAAGPLEKDRLAQWQKDPHLILVAIRTAWMDPGKEPPADGRLSQVLANQMPQAGNLGELDSQLQKRYSGLPGLNYRANIPPVLQSLELNRGSDAPSR